MTSAPIIAGHADGAPLAISAEGTLPPRAFVAAAKSLASRLPPAGCGLLLCEDRVNFALGFAAMLLNRTTALLPPSHAKLALAGIMHERCPAFALVDRIGTVDDVLEFVVDATPGSRFEEVPAIPGEHVAAVVYTSGTTGTPQPNAKTWDSLVRGAAGLAMRVGFRPGDAIVGAVPPQHMWGLEATVMLSLQAGGALHAATPLLPQDIAAALAQSPARRWLVLTPLHVRGCLLAQVPLPSIAGALCATSPLDGDSARAFEQLTAAPLIEIYGSSETGVIGTRRPADEERFVPLAGVQLANHARGLTVGGAHVAPGTMLRDRVEVFADGAFALLGRDADLVKIGGKRASLSMLNRALRDVPGVLDAEFVMSEGSGLSPRLAALVVAPGIEREAIVAALRERIDAVFLPRPLHLVASLERNAVGKLSAETLRHRVEALSLVQRAAGGAQA